MDLNSGLRYSKDFPLYPTGRESTQMKIARVRMLTNMETFSSFYKIFFDVLFTSSPHHIKGSII